MQPNLFAFRACWLAVFSFASASCWSQWEDVSMDNLIEASTVGSWFGCGLSTADYDLDGWDDVTTASSSGMVSLYKGGAEGITLDEEWLMPGEAKAVLWVDLDNDGDLDLLVGVLYSGLYLYMRQADGSLSEESTLRGIPALPSWDVRGVSARDYDQDGDLDLYVTSYHDGNGQFQYQNKLFNNGGLGFFEDVTLGAGVGNGLQHSFQGSWFDFDGDGDDDLWVINDRTVFPNALYRNLGNGVFEDIAEDVNCAIATEAMTATLFDPDNDGDWDQYVTNIENHTNFFLLNTDGMYQNIAATAGVASTQYGWGTCSIDIDGDRWDDMMVATYRFPNGNPYDNHLYMNSGNGVVYTEETENWPNEQLQLYCIGRLDIDGDRSPDVVCHGNSSICQVLRNENSEGASRMTVTLVGVETNTFAVGAVIKAHLDGLTQMRQVEAGCDYLTQHTYKRFFAFGDAEVVDSLEVFWPTGVREVLYDLPADTAIVVIEGSADFALEALDTPCPWDHAAWSVPFDPDEVDMTWNGAPVYVDVVLADSPGSWTLEASWWGGLHTWSQTVEWAPVAAPEWDVSMVPPSCHGDSALVSWNLLEGSVAWALDSLWPSHAVDVAFPGGEHALVMETETGCLLDTTLLVVHPPVLLAELVVEQPACHGDSAVMTWELLGGTPPLVWEFGDFDPNAVPPGIHPLLLTDTMGCVWMDTLSVVEPDPLFSMATWSYFGVTDSATVTLSIEGGTPPYAVTWSGAIDADGGILAPVGLGWFVQDAQGCLHLGVLDVQSNPLAGIGEGDVDAWVCRRESGRLTVRSPRGALFDVTVLDLGGRTLTEQGDAEWEWSAMLDVPGLVIVRVRTPDGAVRHWLK